MSVRESNHNDDPSHQETRLSRLEEMLGKLIESQANLVESQANLAANLTDSHVKLVDSQASTQKQILDILRSTGANAGEQNGSQNIKVQSSPISEEENEEEEIPQVGSDDDNEQKLHQPRQTGQFTRQQTKVNAKHTLEGGEAISKFILDGCDPLYDAAASGDWEMARVYFIDNPQAISEVITNDSHTALHIAVMNMHSMFVEEITNLMPPETLECKTYESGYTALHTAAFYGNREAAEMMVRRNPNLTQICDKQGRVPLALAVQSNSAGKQGVVEYLYSVTREDDPRPFSGVDGAALLYHTIDANFFGLALSLIQRFPELIVERLVEDVCALELMAKSPFAFASKAKLTYWQRCIYSLIQVDERHSVNYFEGTNDDEENPHGSSESSRGVKENLYGRTMKLILIYIMHYLMRVPYIKHLYEQKLMHTQALELVQNMLAGLRRISQSLEFFEMFPTFMKTAIKNGTVEVIKACLQHFPSLIWHDLQETTMIELAIWRRNEIILDLILEASKDEINDLVFRTNIDGNTLLHYAAKLAPSSQLSLVSVPLQMQRELQWYKGVQNIMMEKYKFHRNMNGDTPQFIFTEAHKDLVAEGEIWFKVTSGSCMVVAALIATIAFAVLFSVPGGNISDINSKKNGTPVFLGKASFTIFAMADAIALFSSITSVLMFLGLYTAPYEEEDFFKSLPNKFITGLGTLFLSLTTLLVAFGASLFIVLGDSFPWVLVPIIVFTCIPLILFAWLQLPLFLAVARSTYWGSVFRKYKYTPSRVKQRDNKKKDN